MNPAKGTIGEALAKFAVELKYEDIPKEVLSHLKDVMLDGYGCGLFGTTTPWWSIYKKVLTSLFKEKEVSIWGDSDKTSVVAATMLNGAAINSFELDDTHTEGIIHVSTGVLGCVSSFAEYLGNVSGKDFLVATTLAYEVSCRIAAPVGRILADQGFNNTGVCCPIGSTAACGKLLNLNVDQMIDAFGIAANWSSGLQAIQFESMAKRIVPSKSSEGAIIGSLLAKEGFTGIKDVFENKFGGFYNCFTDDVYDRERIVGDLGVRYELMGIGLKFYSTCRSKHTTIDALKRFRSEHPEVKPEDIEKIVVHTTSITKKYSVDVDRIISVVSAQLSHPYVCAVVMLEGDAFIDQFNEEKIRDPKILELARKVEVVVDPEIDKLPNSLRYTVHVDIYLKDGRSYRVTQVFPKGHPKNPYTREELERKFKILAGKVFQDEERLNRIIETVMNLEDLPNVNELFKLLSK